MGRENRDKVFETYVKSYIGVLPKTNFKTLIDNNKYHSATDDIFDLFLSITNNVLGSDTLINLADENEVKNLILSNLSNKNSLSINNFMVECLYYYIEYILIYRKNIVKDAILLKSNKHIIITNLEKSKKIQENKLNTLLKSIGGFKEFEIEEYNLIPTIIESSSSTQKKIINSYIESIKTLHYLIIEESIKINDLRNKLENLELANKNSYQDFNILIAFEDLKEYLIDNTLN